ncbi:rCG57650 [Rattus norvegicus]|uniref:RCG57650 n=1 Tax=Rattus norvegicus TaxID=10116 RepID=A6JHT8_RAT|nr:rCG57650 [Rattus norvegicus]
MAKSTETGDQHVTPAWVNPASFSRHGWQRATSKYFTSLSESIRFPKAVVTARFSPRTEQQPGKPLPSVEQASVELTGVQ